MCKRLSVFLFVVYSSAIFSRHAVQAAGDNDSSNSNDRWTSSSLADDARHTWRMCSRNLSAPIWECLKDGSLDVFDRMTASAVIPLTDGVRLVKRHEIRDQLRNSKRKRRSWSGHVLQRFASVLATHVLQFDLDEPDAETSSTETARHRHRNQMLPMMIFGVTALGVFVVPMGFQMLAILSGKALLMAKMALLLASMNGLKRVAHSGIHYGLYHSEPAPHHHHAHTTSYWDRQDGQQPANQPRSGELPSYGQQQPQPMAHPFWG